MVVTIYKSDFLDVILWEDDEKSLHVSPCDTNEATVFFRSHGWEKISDEKKPDGRSVQVWRVK